MPAAEQTSPPTQPPPSSSESSSQSSSLSSSSSPSLATTTPLSNPNSITEAAASKISIGTQTDPNLIDKLIDNRVKRHVDDVDLYQEYVRSAQCAQFWPLDKNPIRSLVPAMINVDLPEQYLKNESLMFDLVQAITNNSKLVDLLAKYIHHIVPNVIISKRIDLIPLITCTIRVCRDTNEQERLISLLFNLIKRPNEEQRRMILSGIIVVLQVSPEQSSSLLLPNLWEHVNDKFPERRILLAESCASLAHYVRPIMRSNLVLSILIQLLKDKTASVRSAACKSFACLLTLIMDRNDEVFDACLSATEDIIQDVLQQTPVNFCEFRYELEQMRYCALETIYPLMCLWAVKLNRFKIDVAEFYLVKMEKFMQNLLSNESLINLSKQHQSIISAANFNPSIDGLNQQKNPNSFIIGSTRRHSSFVGASANQLPSSNSTTSTTTLESNFSSSGSSAGAATSSIGMVSQMNANLQTSQRAISAYMKMLDYLIPFVFSDAINGCAWLSKSNLHLADSLINSDHNNNNGHVIKCKDENNNSWPSSGSNDLAEKPKVKSDHIINDKCSGIDSQFLFDRPISYANKLLNPSLIIDESSVIAFHDQLEQDHNWIESLDWILSTFLQKFLTIISYISNKNFLPIISGNFTLNNYNNNSSTNNTNISTPHSPTSSSHNYNNNHYLNSSTTSSSKNNNDSDLIRDFLTTSISSTRQLCLLFGKHLTRNKIRPLIKEYVQQKGVASIYSIYIASLTSFEPIEQQEFEEIVSCIRSNLNLPNLSKSDVEILAITIKTIATSDEQIQSPSTRQKFLTYVLDALVNCSNSAQLRPTTTSLTSSGSSSNGSKLGNIDEIKENKISFRRQFQLRKSQSISGGRLDLQKHQAQMREFILIIFSHILSCLIDPQLRPPDWAHILVTKFLPLLVSLANDPTDVYVCTYARLMCAQLVETFDTYLNSPKLTTQLAHSVLPALMSLKALTQQLKSSNLNRQIECLSRELREKFFKDEFNIDNNNNINNNIIISNSNDDNNNNNDN